MKSRIAIYAERAFVNDRLQPAAFAVDRGIVPISSAEAAIRLDENYVLLPGLINSHDHLEFNSFPILGRRGSYADSYEWAKDIEAQRDSLEIQAALKIPFEDRLRIGGFKNLIAGVTTVAHHNPYDARFGREFPIRVIRSYSWSHSPGLDEKTAETFRRTPPETPWILHAAEGTSKRAADEIDELDKAGLIAPNTVLVHGLAATPSQMTLIRDKGASLIACPVSNQFLYGKTLDFNALPVGIRLALGSDSAASSSSGILEDLQALRAVTHWPEEKLWKLVTTAPAEIFRTPSPLPDLVALRDGEPALVIIDGEVRLTSEEFVDLFAEKPRRLRVRGHVKFLSSRIRLPWRSMARAAGWTPYLREVEF